MNARRLLPALFAALVVSGLFTWFLSRRFAKPVAAAPVRVKRFVAAAKNLEAGEQLQPSMLTLAEWPANQPLKGSFTKPEEIAGRVLLFPVGAGELVLDHHLALPGTGNGLTARIPEGMRAIAVRSDEVAGVAGFLLPGTFVDVLVTYHPSTASPADFGLATTTVLQNARVLTAGQKMEADPDGKANMASVVTLLVTPQEAEKLTLASSLGKILFVLRNTADRKEVAGLTPANFASGIPAHAAEPAAAPQPRAHPLGKTAPAPKPYSVQIIAGSKMSEQTFERNEQ